MSMLRNSLRTAKDRWLAHRDPEGFARSLGVRLKGTVSFYGISRAMFGSEPWLITLGHNVYVAAGVQFITHDGGTLILRKETPDLEWTAPIEVGDDVYIGIRSILLPGVTIGDRCIVGAGSVVTRDVGSNSVVAGVPARTICTVDDYYDRMKNKSLGLGNLGRVEKARELRRIYDRG